MNALFKGICNIWLRWVLSVASARLPLVKKFRVWQLRSHTSSRNFQFVARILPNHFRANGHCPYLHCEAWHWISDLARFKFFSSALWKLICLSSFALYLPFLEKRPNLRGSNGGLVQDQACSLISSDWSSYSDSVSYYWFATFSDFENFCQYM